MKQTLILSIICTVLLFSCNTTQEKSNSTADLLENHDGSSLSKIDIKYAKKFSVTYHDNYKVVRTNAAIGEKKSSTTGLEDIEDLMVLVQKGSTPPPLMDELQSAMIIYVPVQTAAVNVQYSESFLREIGLENRINAIGGLYSYNDEMREKALSHSIGQVGYSWHSPPNFEVLLERKPQVFLMTLASLSHKESLDKSRQLGIPTAPVFDWAESDYLARAEWIKFYSLFFNAEEEAMRVFAEIENNVESLRAMTQNLQIKESALWGFYTSKQQWNMHISSFQAQYMMDAGLKNILANNTVANANGVQSLTTEELLSKGKEAEHWMIGDIHAVPLPQENIMNLFKSWQNGKLYHNMKRVNPKENTSDWYARAVVRPDIILQDLTSLAYPNLLPDHTPVFMGHYDKVTQGAMEIQQ